ncbi:MAG: PadR family transcriptional regulator [Candidatus Verstraetearchaeota archaeon]|nr:PadR family transcriptional regulator [Candidatus Verstraetearchaeota archaeon]
MPDQSSCDPGAGLEFAKQSAPRGLLFLYILHRLSMKPSHGYEILHDVEMRTGGAWRPKPGALYPMLKKMVAAGFIECQRQEEESDQKVYSLTPKGRDLLEKMKRTIRSSGKRMDSLRGIFLEMMGDRDALGFLVESTKGHFEMVRAACRLQPGEHPGEDLVYHLRQYSLLLDNELRWVNSVLKDLAGERYRSG